MATKNGQIASPGFLRKRKWETIMGEKSNKSKDTIKKQRTASGEGDFDLLAGINKSFAHMDSRLLADYVAQRTRKLESDLSSVELEDRYISGNYAKVKLRYTGLTQDSSRGHKRYHNLG